MDIFSVVGVHGRWLEAKLAVSARNIANSDTPGFKAQQVAPFSLGGTDSGFALTATRAGHLGSTTATDAATASALPQANDEASHSGNDVMMEKELASVGEASRGLAFDSGLSKLFHRMVLASVKG